MIPRILMILVLGVTLVSAQMITVVDEQTGQALPGVNITLVGTDQGVHTDRTGQFQLHTDYSEYSLRFSYIGYEDTTLAYGDLVGVNVVRLQSSIVGLDQVEVVSSKLEWEQTDLPSIVTVLRTRELVDQGNLELKEVLQRDPSVVVDESWSGEHEISIRGSNANEVMIIYDDIPMNSSYGGSFDLSWVDLNDIESISIIKGGSTLRYGSGAFGGVVVIDPLKKGGSGLSLNAQKTDDGLTSFSLSDQLQWRQIRTRLTYSSREHHPLFSIPDLVSKRNFLNAYVGYGFSGTDNSLSLGHFQISEAVEPADIWESESVDQTTQLKYQGNVGPIPGIMLHYIQRQNTANTLDHRDTDFHLDQSVDELRHLFGIENKWIHKDLVNFIRFEVKQDGYESVSDSWNVDREYLDQHEVILDQSWIALTEILKYRTPLELPFVDFLELNASYRLDQIDLNTQHLANRDGDVFRDDKATRKLDQTSRRNGFTLNKSHKNLRYQFFYSAGTSLRYPAMRDLYLREMTTIVAYMDSPLLPEMNNSSEVGIQASIQQGGLLDHIDIQASLFRNRFLDKIYYRQIPRALPTPINFSANTELNGFEASLMTSFWENRLSFFAGTSRLNISSYTIFPNKPAFKDVVELEFTRAWGNLRLQYLHEGQQYYAATADNINVEVFMLPGRENLNLFTSLKLKLGRQETILGLSAYNLLSDEDESFYRDERRWVMNLALRL